MSLQIVLNSQNPENWGFSAEGCLSLISAPAPSSQLSLRIEKHLGPFLHFALASLNV